MADKIPQLVNDKPETLATEMLREVKAHGKRWFIIALVELFIILSVVGLFIWYITLPGAEYDIEQAADENSYNQIIGGDYNGSVSEDQLQKTSSAG